jgi:integrase
MAFIVLASKYRKGAAGLIVIGRDGTGARRWRTVLSREQAEQLKAEWTLAEKREPRRRPEINPAITVAEYSQRWLEVHGATLKQRTRTLYQSELTRHILPRFGPLRLRDLHRRGIKRWLATLLAKGRTPQKGMRRPASMGLDRDTVRIAYSTLSTMLNHAKEDELLSANPATGLGKALRLLPAPGERASRIKAMDQAQLDAFLATMTGPAASPHARRVYPFFLLLARTGLRIGEAFALQPEDLDFVRGTLRVTRAFSEGRLEATPKTVASIREVDLSPGLTRVLREHLRRRAELCLGHGWREPWLFLSENGRPYRKQNVARAMIRLCKRAGLSHFTPHDLRHTFASLLIAAGESPKYVQQQLGHASLSMTVDLYGRWLRAKPLRGGVAALDGPSTQGVGENRVDRARVAGASARPAEPVRRPAVASDQRGFSSIR